MARSSAAVLFGLTLCLLRAAPAGAQETTGSSSRADSIVVSPGSTEGRAPRLKSGTTALLWSLLGTGVPATAAAYDIYRAGSSGSPVPGIVFVGAFLIGPSSGHFYAARPRRALLGIGIRTVAGAVIVVAALQDIAGVSSGNIESLGIAGYVVGGASIAVDIITAPHSARVHNEQGRQRRLSFGIAPTPGGHGLGLRAHLTF